MQPEDLARRLYVCVCVCAAWGMSRCKSSSCHLINVYQSNDTEQKTMMMIKWVSKLWLKCGNY